jgi:tetratricopeptide (TPR) repeat protein
MRLQVLLPVIIALVPAVSRLPICSAEDTVTLLTGKDAKTRTSRTGEIVEYTGESLQLKSSSGRVENIPAARVVDIRSTWTLTHERGDSLRAEGKLEEAINAYKQALRDESRVWARRKIMAELVGCYAELGRFDSAGEEWLAIVKSDQLTMHYEVIPVAWHAILPDAALESRAMAWLNRKEPAPQLLGASWLLTGAQRSAAITALEALVTSKTADPRIRSLAQIQLWRTKLVTAKLDEVQRWQSAIEQMPAEIRASGYFVAGEALARLAKSEEASLAFLHIPLVHPQQRVMAADALIAAAQQLENLKRTEQAVGLYREVLSGYSRTAAAEEAKTRLEKK